MSFLIIGGTGTVGSEVVRRLVERGEHVRVLTRVGGENGRISPRADSVVGDLADPPSLHLPLRGIDRVFLLTPYVPDETCLGLNAVEAAREAGVGRLVYMSVHQVEEFAEVLHFANKLPIERAVRESGIPWTILRPNSFFQNDAIYWDDISRRGVYPQPLGGVGLNRVDVRDIADAAVNALTGRGHEGRIYPIVGAEVQTGASIAATYGRLLGQPVHYAGDDVNAWSKRVRGVLSDWLIRDCQETMYPLFQRRGHLATGDDHALCRRILGREPRRFEAYAAELAAGIDRPGPN